VFTDVEPNWGKSRTKQNTAWTVEQFCGIPLVDPSSWQGRRPFVLVAAKISSSKKNQRRLVDGEFAFNFKSLKRQFDSDPPLAGALCTSRLRWKNPGLIRFADLTSRHCVRPRCANAQVTLMKLSADSSRRGHAVEALRIIRRRVVGKLELALNLLLVHLRRQIIWDNPRLLRSNL
jgi:hypothetical protein